MKRVCSWCSRVMGYLPDDTLQSSSGPLRGAMSAPRASDRFGAEKGHHNRAGASQPGQAEQITHGICPECFARIKSEIVKPDLSDSEDPESYVVV